jgi:signal peptidase I
MNRDAEHDFGRQDACDKHKEPAGTGGKKAPPSYKRQLVHCAIAGAIAVSTYLLSSHFVFQKVVVDGDSMNPTLRDSQTFLLNRVEYLFRKPQWGDIVVIRDPEDGGLSIKRVVAVEGQSVELEGGRVFIDGLKLPENYLRPGTRTFSYHNCRSEKFDCGQGQFFVLGDNRDVSADSRVYGPVPRQNILGVVVP